MSLQLYRLAPLAAACLCAPALVAAQSTSSTLEEIVVTAGLRDTHLSELPASVTVLDESTLRTGGVQQLQDVLSEIPNLSWASGSARPRFFLLRGIGEVEQYQGAPNPSVGFLIDDIDFSGIGMPATLFDTRQVEVLRGPQGTVYGANALAGLINVRTEDPTADFTLHGEATVGEFSARAAAVAVSDSFDDTLAGWRIAAQQYHSNGYFYNAYAQRHTDQYDEGTLRGKLFWQITPALRAELAVMDVDLNNGYDAFTIDNSYVTLSNQPGRDKQQSLGASLKLSLAVDAFGELRSVTSGADSHVDYSFDDDWANDAYWTACCGYSPYDYFTQDRNQRRTASEDLRFIGNDEHRLLGNVRWVAGAYFLRLSENDDLLNSFDDAMLGQGSSLLLSHYVADDVALYASFDSTMTTHQTLTLGMRGEQRLARYEDSADVASPFPDIRDTMLGGNLSWQYLFADREHLYVTLARGFKGGGFNIGEQIPADVRSFSPEYLWNLETGFNASTQDQRLQGGADLFYMRRDNMQVYSSCQLQQDNPATFVFFTQNASHGENYGLEAQGLGQLTQRWQLSATAGLLHTRYLGYESAAITCPGASPLALDGRAQSFAPEYQFSVALSYTNPSGFFGRLDESATDGFYFAAGQNQVAQAYQLMNLRLGYRQGHYQVSLWTQNLLNARYAVQGFYFGLVPPDFPNQRFVQNGEPRTLGLTVRFDLGKG